MTWIDSRWQSRTRPECSARYIGGVLPHLERWLGRTSPKTTNISKFLRYELTLYFDTCSISSPQIMDLDPQHEHSIPV